MPAAQIRTNGLGKHLGGNSDPALGSGLIQDVGDRRSRFEALLMSGDNTKYTNRTCIEDYEIGVSQLGNRYSAVCVMRAARRSAHWLYTPRGKTL
jgi:hypothetical protein